MYSIVFKHGCFIIYYYYYLLPTFLTRTTIIYMRMSMSTTGSEFKIYVFFKFKVSESYHYPLVVEVLSYFFPTISCALFVTEKIRP